MRHIVRNVFVSLLLFSMSVLAQSPTANVVGIVRDATGAAVPGAAIKVRNQGTNEVRQAQSGGSGEFSVANLQPGFYEVTAEKTGFAVLRETDLELQVNQTARLQLQLKVGSISEAVEVKAQAPLLNTENASKGDVISTEELLEMPLDGRTFQDLAFLVPGVLPNAQGDNAGPFAINGARSDNTNMYMDGFNIREPSFGGVQVPPSLDAMQEFKMETSGFSAEYGRFAGGVVSAVLKSGTNQLHGGLFEFLRNDKFDARNFFAADKSELRRNQFGGTLGGPLWIPKIYNGRNRTFFFFSWEGYRDAGGNIQLSRVPTSLERQGNFSQTVDANGKLVQLKDPFASNTLIPGNQIPLSRFNPISAQILPYWPLENRPGQANNYLAVASSHRPWNSFLWKFDQLVSSKDNLSFRFQRRTDLGSTPFAGSPLGTFGTMDNYYYGLIGLNLTHLFTPTLINEFRFGLTRNGSNMHNLDTGRDFAKEFGINGIETDPKMTGFPAIAVTTEAALGDKIDRPWDAIKNNYQWSDAVTWVKNKHQFKFGGEILRTQIFQPYLNNPRGNFNFLGNWTNQAFADFVLGLMDYANRQTVPPQNYLFLTDYSAFAQDDFKVTSRLTLNLGLRWEIPGPQYDKYGRYAGFVPELGKIIVADDRATPNFAALVAGAGLTNTVGLARDYGIPKALVYTRYFNLAPRFGFAWRPFGGNATVLRGGYGIFDSKSATNPLVTNMSNVFPSAITVTVNKNLNNPNGLTFANPFQNGIGPTATTIGVGGVQLHAPTPYLQSWNLTVERELRRFGAVEMAYSGSKGTQLGYSSDVNRPFYSLDMKLPNGSFPRPYPQINNVITMFNFGGNSIYSAGTVTFRRRFNNGFFYRANYVYGKSIDNGSALAGGSNGGFRQIQNPRDLSAERGRSNFDAGHSFTMNFSYQIPWRRSDFRWLMRGWQMAGSGRAMTGQAITPVTANFNLSLGNAIRPDRFAKGTVPNPTPERWFDRSAFAIVPNGSFRFGTSGRNILDGPGLQAINLSLHRNIQIRERSQIQFRWEVFNALNHANFNTPSATANTAVNLITGGTITSAQAARSMQFGLRYQF